MPRKPPSTTTRALQESIGQRLARLRRERGITQVELAAQLGVTQSNVSACERGEVRLHCDLIVEVCKILEVTSDELLGLGPPPGSLPVRDRRFLQRLAQIEQLPKRKKDALLTTIKTFLSEAER